jgi:hypothetical protein
MLKHNYYNEVAQIYDRTRWLTPSIAEEVTDFILNFTCTTSAISILEPGVGNELV